MKSVYRRKERAQETGNSPQEIEPERTPSALPKNSSNWLVEYLALGGLIAIIVFIVGACLLFAPLILAGLEYFTFGTSYVEDFFREIQLHETLGRLYAPLMEKLRSLFGF